MIKLVALDLDGTLVNEQLEISAATLSGIRRARADGIRVVVATGRMFPSTVPFAKTLGVTDPVISYQGAMIRDITCWLDNVHDHPILFHQTIEIDIAHALMAFIEDHGFHSNVYINDQLFTTQFNPSSAYYQGISGVIPQEAPHLTQILTHPPSKIMIIDDQAQQIAEELRQRFGTQISLCLSRYNFCEIVHSSVSKWQALQQLMRQWDIEPAEVLAIGDQENDLPMITHAGVGVAMGNAPAHVKAHANYVTETIENDGAAKAIEKFVYGHLPLDDQPGVASG